MLAGYCSVLYILLYEIVTIIFDEASSYFTLNFLNIIYLTEARRNSVRLFTVVWSGREMSEKERDVLYQIIRKTSTIKSKIEVVVVFE